MTDWIDAAEIIDVKPFSGEFDEVLFGSDKGNTLWVKFADHDGAYPWIGKFGTGHTTVMRVAKAIEPDRFFVTAGGFGYLVDATKRTLLNHHFPPYLAELAYDPGRDEFIAADVGLRIVSQGLQRWASKRISVDWIRDLSVRGRSLWGVAFVGSDSREEAFEFDLDRREFKQGGQPKI
ncbi:MAG TPA: hypothetical protein VHC86_05540 [Opitutaceae bacterium]|nr:hypothetical protein [Opitutaceae bacterium]